MRPTQRILVIDDEPQLGELIIDIAQAMGLTCTTTTNPANFLEALGPNTSLVILDLMMPSIDGIELLRLIADYKYQNGIVLMSGVETRVIETAEQFATALGLSIVGRLKKPFQISTLEAVLKIYEQIPVQVSSDPELVEILDEQLQTAIQNGEFVLHYQPQIQIKTGKVVGFEGLVRWLHPKRGVVYPDCFIERLEALDLIDQLGWIGLKTGIENWHSFVDMKGDILTLSLNVATRSLRDTTFPDKLGLLLKQHNMPPAKLILEVTESGILGQLPGTLEVVTRLRLKGIQIAIDDFGLGYSMLQQLRHTPATELKIDKSFIHGMLSNSGDRIVVNKAIEIGHELGMIIVAVGVETQAELDHLSRYGCDVAQAYLIYKPQPLAVVLGWVERYHFISHLPTPTSVVQ